MNKKFDTASKANKLILELEKLKLKLISLHNYALFDMIDYNKIEGLLDNVLKAVKTDISKDIIYIDILNAFITNSDKIVNKEQNNENKK